jgi:hypothetical protein
VSVYRHIGGAVVSDLGPLPLAAARDLAGFYGLEAVRAAELGQRRSAAACARRALALHDAAEEARRWRRAAGWAKPEAADISSPVIPETAQPLSGSAASAGD